MLTNHTFLPFGAFYGRSHITVSSRLLLASLRRQYDTRAVEIDNPSSLAMTRASFLTFRRDSTRRKSHADKFK